MQFELSFVKYHGCGNDFIIIDELEGSRFTDEQRAKLAQKLCQRRFGVGANDLLFLLPSEKWDAKLRIFDPDGSEADMCGNGLRCAADYLCNKLGKSEVSVETRAGVKHVTRMGNQYVVQMGSLKSTLDELSEYIRLEAPAKTRLFDLQLEFPEVGATQVSFVNTGEPHAVIFVDDVDKEDINRYAVGIAANRRVFPKGISVNLAQVVDESTIKMRTYERGVWEETLACGTGATASAAVALLTGRIKSNEVKVLCKGGTLTIKVEDEGKTLIMIGPATKVYEGKMFIEL